MDSIQAAQQDMRSAYFNGVPGIVSSGTVWLAAGLVALWFGPINGVITLLVAGTLIFPASVVLCKCLGRSGKHASGNPLAPLAMEGTVWMLMCMPVAAAVALYHIEWFFPAMLLVIGGRYLTFTTLYGLRVYWLLGGGVGVLALTLAVLQPPAFVSGLAGGLAEWMFAGIVFAGRSK